MRLDQCMAVQCHYLISSRRLYGTRLCWMIQMTRMSWSTCYHPFISFRQSLTKGEAYWCIVKLELVSIVTPFILLNLMQCAGRSATIVAAYLMYSRDLDTNAALELIKKARPNIEYDWLSRHTSVNLNLGQAKSKLFATA